MLYVIISFIGAAMALIEGVSIDMQAKSVMHQSLGAQYMIIAAIMFVGGALLLTINKKKKEE